MACHLSTSSVRPEPTSATCSAATSSLASVWSIEIGQSMGLLNVSLISQLNVVPSYVPSYVPSHILSSVPSNILSNVPSATCLFYTILHLASTFSFVVVHDKV